MLEGSGRIVNLGHVELKLQCFKKLKHRVAQPLNFHRTQWPNRGNDSIRKLRACDSDATKVTKHKFTDTIDRNFPEEIQETQSKNRLNSPQFHRLFLERSSANRLHSTESEVLQAIMMDIVFKLESNISELIQQWFTKKKGLQMAWYYLMTANCIVSEISVIQVDSTVIESICCQNFSNL